MIESLYAQVGSFRNIDAFDDDKTCQPHFDTVMWLDIVDVALCLVLCNGYYLAY